MSVVWRINSPASSSFWALGFLLSCHLAWGCAFLSYYIRMPPLPDAFTRYSRKYFKLSQFSSFLNTAPTALKFCLLLTVWEIVLDIALYWIPPIPYILYGQDQSRSSVSEKSTCDDSNSQPQQHPPQWGGRARPGGRRWPRLTAGRHLCSLPWPLLLDTTWSLNFRLFLVKNIMLNSFISVVKVILKFFYPKN